MRGLFIEVVLYMAEGKLLKATGNVFLTSRDDDRIGFPSIFASKLRLLTEGNNTERKVRVS